MPTRCVLLATILVAANLTTNDQGATAADAIWPGWLGPQRNGWAESFQPPNPWPAQLERRWQVEVGEGYASPLVVAGSVYQHARQGDEEVVWRIDHDSGQVAWRKSYPVPFTMGRGGERHGKGPKSSPVLADDRLFTLSITAILSAWDAESGELLWQRDYRSQFEKAHPYWGASTSPLVDGDRI
ncbi:MAG: PQQ-binding-like beta-propeller repeat protein, partial [Planctomycetota bacterium]